MVLVLPALPSLPWSHADPPPAPDPHRHRLMMISNIAVASAIMFSTIWIGTTMRKKIDTTNEQMIKKDALISKKIHKNWLLPSSFSGLYCALSLPIKFLKGLVFIFKGNLNVLGMLTLLLPLVKGDDLHPGLTFK